MIINVACVINADLDTINCTEREPAHDNAKNPQRQNESTGNKLCLL